MKKIIFTGLLFGMLIIYFFAPVHRKDRKIAEAAGFAKDDFVPTDTSNNEDYVETENSSKQEPAKLSEDEILAAEMQKMNEEMLALDSVEDKRQWFISYKAITEKYAHIFGKPRSIYDCFSSEELLLLFRVVQAEIGEQGSFEEKANVASVIFNRLDSEKFPDNLAEILIPGQFSTISSGAYKNTRASEGTILACEYAYQIEDTTDGALFFEGKNSNVHGRYATFLFQDGAGHKFYK